MAIDYTKETKKVIEEMKDVKKTLRYFPKVITEYNQKLRDNLLKAYKNTLKAYKNTLESDLLDLLNALLDWNDAGNQIFEEKTETKCDRGMAAGFSCEICADYDCESNPEGKV